MAIRLIEYSWFELVLNKDVPWFLLLGKSVNLDIQYLGFILGLCFIPIFLLHIISKWLSKGAIFLLSTVLILIQISLTHFHLTNHTLLSALVFQFSVAELLGIVGAEMSSSNFIIFTVWSLLFLIFMTLIVKSLRNVKSSKNKSVSLVLFIGLIFNSLINIPYTYKSLDAFDSVNHFLFANSKPVFLFESYKGSLGSGLGTYEEHGNDFLTFQREFDNRLFTSLEYPLMHKVSMRNELGSFFKKTNKSPNIVLVISESLSSSYSVSGAGFDGTSFTTFTDSLAGAGLYWSNFLSNAYRSYGVLPSVLGSVPPSDNLRGFINLNNKKSLNPYPSHYSLIDLLNDNDYTTNHYYPGWSDFDNTKGYMSNLGVDNFIDEKDFDRAKYNRYGDWGFSDYELFHKGLDHLEKVKKNKPFFASFQTIGFHSPFDMVEPKYLKKSYLDKQKVRFKFDSLNRNINKFSDDYLSSILAADDALKYLFYRLKKSNDFENTIFIITGDHDFGIDFHTNPLFNFHVPLIIYSPLLNRSKVCKGVSSHLDIAPSLEQLLSGNFGLDINEESPWLGNGLDTSSIFVSKGITPLDIHGLTRPNYIHGNRFILGSKVYRFEDGFIADEEENTDSVQYVKKSFDIFKKVNTYTTKENKIWKEFY